MAASARRAGAGASTPPAAAASAAARRRSLSDSTRKKAAAAAAATAGAPAVERRASSQRGDPSAQPPNPNLRPPRAAAAAAGVAASSTVRGPQRRGLRGRMAAAGGRPPLAAAAVAANGDALGRAAVLLRQVREELRPLAAAAAAPGSAGTLPDAALVQAAAKKELAAAQAQLEELLEWVRQGQEGAGLLREGTSPQARGDGSCAVSSLPLDASWSTTDNPSALPLDASWSTSAPSALPPSALQPSLLGGPVSSLAVSAHPPKQHSGPTLSTRSPLSALSSSPTLFEASSTLVNDTGPPVGASPSSQPAAKRAPEPAKGAAVQMVTSCCSEDSSDDAPAHTGTRTPTRTLSPDRPQTQPQSAASELERQREQQAIVEMVSSVCSVSQSVSFAAAAAASAGAQAAAAQAKFAVMSHALSDGASVEQARALAGSKPKQIAMMCESVNSAASASVSRHLSASGVEQTGELMETLRMDGSEVRTPLLSGLPSRQTSGFGATDGLRSEDRQQSRMQMRRQTTNHARELLGRHAAQEHVQWQRINMLGRGAFGSVYLGVIPNGEFVAVKEMDVGDNVDGVEALVKEIELMTTMEHENIVEYRHAQIDEERHMLQIFLEYVAGGSLASLFKKMDRPPEEQLVRMYTQQMLEGLAFLHGMGIVHRDIKGDNCLLDPNGTVKLADFGCSRKVEVQANVGGSVRATMMALSAHMSANAGAGVSAEGMLAAMHCTMVGTPFWMAPEVLSASDDAKYDGKAADVWSVGCTVAELFQRGRPPWPADLTNTWQMILYISDPANRPKMPDRLGSDAEEMLEECWKKDPGQRPSVVDLKQLPFVCRIASGPSSPQLTRRRASVAAYNDSPSRVGGRRRSTVSAGYSGLATFRFGAAPAASAEEATWAEACECGNVFLEDATFCRKCGRPRRKQTVDSPTAASGDTCGKCGNVYMDDAVYCRRCGSKRELGSILAPMNETMVIGSEGASASGLVVSGLRVAQSINVDGSSVSAARGET